jgi:23S rRNA-/tRNA-specific pseudouridylate synthase
MIGSMARKAESRITALEAGMPLLDWLSARFSYLGAEAWREELAAGRVSVDGIGANPSRRLAAGELVAYSPPPRVEPPVERGYAILHECADFLVVDKPALLPVHPGGAFFEHSLWFLLRERFGRIHIATRLDRETSGLVLVARTPEAARHLHGLLAEGGIDKGYLVLVHGRFPAELRAEGYLVGDAASAVRKKRRYIDGGKEQAAARAPDAAGAGASAQAADPAADPARPGVESCLTEFRLLATRADGEGRLISLLAAFPRSGRTHQIRATLSSLGWPVVGDKLYGLDEGCFLRFIAGTLDGADRAGLGLEHQALHAASLRFPDLAGRQRSFRSLPRWANYERLFEAELRLAAREGS